MAVQTTDTEVADGAHVVKFYEHDTELVDAVVPYLAAAVHGGEVAVLIATPEHRAAFDAALEAHGVEVARAVAEDRLVPLDAAATLARLHDAGKIDPQAFHEVIGGLVRSASAGGRPVRAYGEMVALLWDAGDVLAAIELETLWHELGAQVDFTLFCAYRAASVAEAVHAPALQQICRLHSAVLSPTADERSRRGCAQTGISARFAAEPDSPGRARRLVVDAVRHWGATQPLANDVALLVSELTSNAVRHADSTFSLTVRASGSTLRVEVQDALTLAGSVSEEWLLPQPLHGLSLVDALCTSWGVEDKRDGKLVWAELPFEPTAVAQG